MPLDYETLRLIWWLFLATLITGFAIMDGFDLGVAAQLMFVARDDTERRVAINSIAPVWDGNQVWFVLGGGAIFAAFPLLYATAFSGFYAAMFLVLLAFIVRPVGFDFRNKLSAPRWRAVWDVALTASGVVASVVFGVAVGNLFEGVPFDYNGDLRMAYHGGLLGLLNPFALMTGVLALSMLLMHGAAYLGLKTEGEVAERARRVLTYTGIVVMVLFTIGGVWVAFGIPGYRIISAIDPSAPSNPLAKTVARQAGTWMANYAVHPWMLAAPVLGYLGAGAAIVATRKGRAGLAFIASALMIAGIIFTAGLSLFPFMLPSSLAPSHSLTVWDASSSQRTLFIMFLATVVFLPIVILYTSWVFGVLRGKVTKAYIRENSNSLY